MFAGDAERAYAGHDRLLELGAEAGRDMASYGLEFVATRPGAGYDAAALRDDWEARGGTHFAPSSMGQGLTTIDEHIAFFERFITG